MKQERANDFALVHLLTNYIFLLRQSTKGNVTQNIELAKIHIPVAITILSSRASVDSYSNNLPAGESIEYLDLNKYLNY